MRLRKNEILVLRTCSPDGKSHGGFQWPDKGTVEAPDWVDDDKCGHGLHGLPWGAGGAAYVLIQGDNVWVVKVDTSKDYRHGSGDLRDKCKFRSGVVVLSHVDITEAMALIQRHAPHDIICNFAFQTAGAYSTQTAGDCSTQTAGYDSTQKAGVGTVQIIHYYHDDEWKVKTRVITEKEAGKPYKFENGKWRLVSG